MGDNTHYVVADKDDEVGFLSFFPWFISYEAIFIFILGWIHVYDIKMANACYMNLNDSLRQLDPVWESVCVIV